MNNLIKNHPCFDDNARYKYQRIHLPVAPRCNIQCNFCNRKFDCINESRPGVTSEILTPIEALEVVKKIKKDMPDLKVVGIAGPGDPFANPVETIETLRLVKNNFPEFTLCVATNGLALSEWVDEIVKLKISHVTITVNAVNPEIGAKIYAWIRYNKRVISGIEASEKLLENQLVSINKLKFRDIIIKINSVVIKGVNDSHIVDIARIASKLGVDIFNPIPLYPVEGSFFNNLKEPSIDFMKSIRKDARQYINVMTHCSRCRADAAGYIYENKTVFDYKVENDLQPSLTLTEKKIAVSSKEGVLINQHLGEAETLDIYFYKDGKYSFIEKRKIPERGLGDQRWIRLSEILSDCFLIITSGAGNKPISLLNSNNIAVLISEGIIEDVLNKIVSGFDLNKLQNKFSGCKINCSGSGTGCGA